MWLAAWQGQHMALSQEEQWLATLRPSRIREVQAGRLGWAEADLLAVGEVDARPLRDGLETFGIKVNLIPIGQARHLITALGDAREIARYVVIACHGDEGRILLDELADEVARFQPFEGSMGPDEVRQHLRLPGRVVICTGCDTGDEALAKAFLEAGASAYLAPTGAPFGYASFFAPLMVFYELTELRTLEQAVDRLQQHDGELAMWKLFR